VRANPRRQSVQVRPHSLVVGRLGTALSRRVRHQQRHDLATVGDLNLFCLFTHAAQHLSGLLFELPDTDRFHKSSSVPNFVGTF
jgi:hypothetical protein